MNIEDKRKINERKFTRWEDFPDGGRKYWLEINGKHGWKARYVKEVNASEETVRFYQEIYDEHNSLVEIHEKFPMDKGHKAIKKEG
ncbi:MAG: hypothetical protein M0Z70_03660 [Nitrospiraceae bacterium]|nr:hypothetical protein [Nitrospirota bacterium]MDA8338383.1 hypothetical protein [Nitrospiraceae bacterium]